MTDHANLRLRAITISTRAALESLHDDEDAPAVRSRADALLADLERDIERDGADPDLLRRVAAARAEVGAEEPVGDGSRLPDADRQR